VTFNGTPLSAGAYGVVSKPYALRQGALVVASGMVRKGGVLLGLLDSEEKWAVTVAIPTAGRFQAAVAAPAHGTYKIVLANNLPAHVKQNDAEVSEVGLIGPGSAAPTTSATRD
jgi:hypothetical protein